MPANLTRRYGPDYGTPLPARTVEAAPLRPRPMPGSYVPQRPPVTAPPSGGAQFYPAPNNYPSPTSYPGS